MKKETVTFNLHGKEYTINKKDMLRVQCAIADRIKVGLEDAKKGKSVVDCLRDTLQKIDAELKELPVPLDLSAPSTLSRIKGNKRGE